MRSKSLRFDERRPGHPITPSPCLQIMEHAQRMRLVGWQIDEKARAFARACRASKASQREIGRTLRIPFSSAAGQSKLLQLLGWQSAASLPQGATGRPLQLKDTTVATACPPSLDEVCWRETRVVCSLSTALASLTKLERQGSACSRPLCFAKGLTSFVSCCLHQARDGTSRAASGLADKLLDSHASHHM